MATQFYNNLKTALFLAVLTGLILVGGELIAGQRGLVIALIMAGVMNFTGYFYSDQIALASAGAVGSRAGLSALFDRLIGLLNPTPRAVAFAHAACPQGFKG